MSAVLGPSGPCFGANPDVSGIGVRTAIYAQNLLSFVPALLALKDGKVTPTELDALETQSTTILITAFAILVSTIVQASTSSTSNRLNGISNYHASIVLDLSWMNNTNLFIYLLLYTYRRVNLSDDELGEEAMGYLKPDTPRLARCIYEARKAIMNHVIIIGTLHLSLMASVGIWLWSNPAQFGKFPPSECSLSASAVVVGRAFLMGSTGLQAWSILVYSILLIPFLNLLIPIALFAVPLFVFKHSKGMQLYRIMIGLGMLAVIDVVLLVDTEVGIKKNLDHGLIAKDEGAWTFGQTLALLLLLVPLCDLSEALWERRAKSMGQTLLEASETGETAVVKYLLKRGAQKDDIGMAFGHQ
ncbi:hypothetical protein H0H87_008850 [Tephrocybe sp. NHM501043]|nr:hypothetical protein H0H87_008849 [Tephrocybe sp. NHM501043]KAG6844214.1 hypothetical protein H0H87_008850 [Tephrocybe sp. NHM501043]